MTLLSTTPVPVPLWYEPWKRWRWGLIVKRPVSAPTLIPKWAWLQLKEDTRVRNEQMRFDLWRKPGAWMSWGFANGQFTPAEVAEWAKVNGYAWIGVQDTPQNRARRDQIKNAFRNNGIKLVIWEWSKDAQTALDTVSFWLPDGFSANVEHFGPWAEMCDRLRVKYPYMPLSVFTNFWGAGAVSRDVSPTGYDRGHAAPFVVNDFACITESYMVNEEGPQPTLHPEELEFTARTHLGYKEVFPCFGIYRCSPAFYSALLPSYPAHSWYLLEYHPAFKG